MFHKRSQERRPRAAIAGGITSGKRERAPLPDPDPEPDPEPVPVPPVLVAGEPDDVEEPEPDCEVVAPGARLVALELALKARIEASSKYAVGRSADPL